MKIQTPSSFANSRLKWRCCETYYFLKASKYPAKVYDVQLIAVGELLIDGSYRRSDHEIFSDKLIESDRHNVMPKYDNLTNFGFVLLAL